MLNEMDSVEMEVMCMDKQQKSTENNDTDDLSSDSDLSEELENESNRKYNDIMGKIKQQKYCYDNYIELVDIAYNLNDLDKIRESNEIFASVYPLAPEIWLKRLKVEQSIASREDDFKSLYLLFKRALSDYYSLDVALEYARLTFNSPKSSEIWEELISTYALHCMDGYKLFDLWREYINEVEPESLVKYEKLIKTYELELAIPFCEKEKSYIDLKVLTEKNKDTFMINWHDIDEKYNKAKEQSNRIRPYEKQIVGLVAGAHQERAALYKDYITEAANYLHPNIVQVLYERMVAECCLNPTCWLNYIKFIQNRDGLQSANSPKSITEQAEPLLFSQTDWDIVNRALRNCSWSVEIYVEKLRIAEQIELPPQEIRNIVEFAIAADFETPEPLVRIWIEYISYLRRHTNFDNEREMDLLRDTFDLAWTSLGKQYGELADTNCELLKIWGRLEYGALNSFTKAKELWTTVMISGDNSSKSGLWIEFANLEMRRGADGVRKVFRKALSVDHMDNIDVIISAWTRFEYNHGTLDQLKVCQERCNERKTHEFKTISKYTAQYRTKGNKRNLREDRLENHQSKKVNKGNNKMKQADEDSNAIRKKLKLETDILGENSDRTSTKRIKTDKPDTTNLSMPIQEIDTSKDSETIFVSNLDYNITENDLSSAFPELIIENVNIIKTNTGKSRGFAYVTLQSKNDVYKSLALDRRLINGRPVYISNVLRDRGDRIKFKYADTMESKKLFIRGLPFDATKEELNEIFSEFGLIKDVRVVFHKSGKSKGIAYVEFNDEESVSNAIRNKAEFQLRNFKVSIAISAPPARHTTDETSVKKLHLTNTERGGQSTKIAPRDLKPRMTFIPRVIQKMAMETAQSNDGGNEQTPTPIVAKTNEDFRKLLKLSK